MELRRLIEPLLGEEPQSTVLPWRRPDGDGQGVDNWFALARSASELYEVRADLQAFIGTTYARIQGGHLRQSKDTPFAHALQEMTDGYVFAFTGEGGAVLRGVLRWLEVRAARPDRDIPETRSTGLLLRDFDAALQTHDRELARAVLTFLRTDHRLDSRNLQFLEVKLHAAFQAWGELLRHATATRVVQLRRRPVAVTDALLRAVYHVHLREASREGDLEVLGATLEQISSTMAPLWALRTGLQSLTAWLTYGLAAGLVEEDYEGVEAAHAAVTERGGDGNLLSRLLEHLETPPLPGNPRHAFIQRDYDQALDLARTLPEGPDRAGLLVLLSRELGTLEVQQEAWEAIKDLTEDEEARLSTVERDALSALEAALTPVEARVDGWIDLLKALGEGALSHAQVLRLAQAGHAEWTLHSLTGDVDTLLEVLLEIPDQQQQTLQDILTYIIDVLQLDEAYPNPVLREVYDLILLILLETPYPRPDAFYNAVDLVSGILGAIDEATYNERIKDILNLLERTTARLRPDRLLDFLDLLVASDCPNEAVRQTCFTFVEQHRQQSLKQWSRSQWRFLLDLTEEVGLAGLVVPLPPLAEGKAESVDQLAALSGKHLGVYTLTESAGRRFVRILQQRVSDLQVSLSHAKVSTDRLTAMAQHADVLVVVTSSATHAGTAAIYNNIGPDSVLVRPKGKGSSSMLSALEEALQ